MVRITTSMLAFTTLAACGGGKLSDEDLSTFFAAQSTVSSDVSTQVVTEAANAEQTGKDLVFDGDMTGWDITGEIEGAGILWSGTIGVDGSGSFTEKVYDWDLGLTYDTVEAVTADVTMDGEMDQAWSVSYDDAGSYHSEYSMVGELEATGSIEGRAEMDFSMSIDYDLTTGAYSYTYEGTINGTDVNDFSGSGSMDM